MGSGIESGQFCVCIGCRDEAEYVIDHDEHGRRVVCRDHVREYRIIGTVEDGEIEVVA